MSIEAGRLRHRVKVQRQIQSQDTLTGQITVAWETIATVWADIQPLSAREFIQSQSMQSQIVARIVIRYRDGIGASMRLVHVRLNRDDVVYNIHGVLPDAAGGMEYLTLPCSAGVADGQ
jgi:SPP1 family predicted phage head-tail adaptor